MDFLSLALGLLSGGAVGFTLGLIGGGGSVLAVPLMVYVVGVKDPHVAIGTSAFAVAINALNGLFSHARAGHVVWRCGAAYAAAGIVGALLGSTAGKAVNGQHLLLLFALVMLLVGILMLRHRNAEGIVNVTCDRTRASRAVGFGFGTGLFAGFFGIGGGFLVVPGLLAATNMAIINAVGTSLVAVSAFGLTTAANYAVSGLVDWPLAASLIAGGAVGILLGTRAARRLAADRGRLSILFAGLVFLVAGYMILRGLTG